MEEGQPSWYRATSPSKRTGFHPAFTKPALLPRLARLVEITRDIYTFIFPRNTASDISVQVFIL